MRDRSPVEIYDNYLIPQVIENTSRGLEAAVLADEPSVFTSHPVAALGLAQVHNDHAAT